MPELPPYFKAHARQQVCLQAHPDLAVIHKHTHRHAHNDANTETQSQMEGGAPTLGRKQAVRAGKKKSVTETASSLWTRQSCRLPAGRRRPTAFSTEELKSDFFFLFLLHKHNPDARCVPEPSTNGAAPNTLNDHQRKSALRSLLFRRRRRCSDVKMRSQNVNEVKQATCFFCLGSQQLISALPLKGPVCTRGSFDQRRAKPPDGVFVCGANLQPQSQRRADPAGDKAEVRNSPRPVRR